MSLVGGVLWDPRRRAWPAYAPTSFNFNRAPDHVRHRRDYGITSSCATGRGTRRVGRAVRATEAPWPCARSRPSSATAPCSSRTTALRSFGEMRSSRGRVPQRRARRAARLPVLRERRIVRPEHITGRIPKSSRLFAGRGGPITDSQPPRDLG